MFFKIITFIDYRNLSIPNEVSLLKFSNITNVNVTSYFWSYKSIFSIAIDININFRKFKNHILTEVNSGNWRRFKEYFFFLSITTKHNDGRKYRFVYFLTIQFSASNGRLEVCGYIRSLLTFSDKKKKTAKTFITPTISRYD